MKLVADYTNEIQILSEEIEGAPTRLFIQGPFIQANVVNNNRRRYPLSVARDAVKKYRELQIAKNRALGELNHPNPPTPKIDPKNVCIKIVSLIEEGATFIGKALVTSTPMGQIVSGLINDGVSMGVSSRALASFHEENGVQVVDSMHLATAADVVTDPSAPDAFVQGIQEDREWICESGIWTFQEIDQAKSNIKKIRSAHLLEDCEKIFQKMKRLSINGTCRLR